MPSNGKAGSLSAPAGGEMLTRGRRRWATGQIAGATALAAAVFVTAFACILLTKELHNPAAVWLSDGIVIAVLLRQPRARWGAILGAGAIGVATANLAAGEGFVMSLGMAASNVLAMLTCAVLVTRMVAQPRVDLTNPRHLPAFLIAGGVVAPMLASLAGVLVLRSLVGAPWWPTAPQWFVSESLGILLTTPAVLALGEGGAGPLPREVPFRPKLPAGPDTGRHAGSSLRAGPLSALLPPAARSALLRPRLGRCGWRAGAVGHGRRLNPRRRQRAWPRDLH